MKERLNAFIISKGLTATRFAELLDVQPSSISHILSGRNNPSYDFINKFLTKFTDVNPDWLLMGNGEMYRQTEEVDKPNNKQDTPDDKVDERSKSPNIDDIDNSSYLGGLLFDERHSMSSKGDSNAEETAGGINITNTMMNTVDGEIRAKKAEKIVIFYSDKTFIEYTPE